MFWWFERKGRFLRCEARGDLATGFTLSIVDADGVERLERFSDAAALEKRQLEFEEHARRDGWTGPIGWNL